ncbi:low specificity L-threonine aldolase [Lachnospiraceae bacterium ZAX-1]
MILFDCDYTEGAHPLVLQKLVETNMEQTIGYGEDKYCAMAATLLKEKCKAPKADVHFLVGGTQTNMTIISAALRPHQGVLCAPRGHINMHEAGAIESTGHKVIVLESENGKLSAAQVEAYVAGHFADESWEHIVQPKMVYISNPTELGTIYKKEELKAISDVCKERGLYLFLDGARLGYGLCCEENDIELTDYAKYCDVFYIGGTKVGALFGEAVVIVNDELKKDFRYNLKQKGGMLAKGRLLGLQFLALFESDLYFEISSHAIRLAERIRTELKQQNISFYVDSPTNQQFPILPDTVCEILSQDYTYAYEARVDENHSAIRFCTNWATKEENVDALLRDIRKLLETEQ